MKVRLTKQHVERACAERKSGQPVHQCCPVYQALKDAGVSVTAVGISTFGYIDGLCLWQASLPKEAKEITALDLYKWHEIKETEFEVQL